MPGESLLVVDDSLAVQDIARSVLEGAGYRVATAGNGASAMTYPGIEDVDMLIIDGHMAGLSGEETVRLLKQHESTHPIPVLLLMSEGHVPERESLEPMGTCAFLLKPFTGRCLIQKVEQILDQQNLDEMARQYLADRTDHLMKELADQQIQAAIERKTQIIIERCIQNVVNAVDQRARAEVDERITGLLEEKEQELVKLTVREVAQSMVEKLAERKVEEAMEGILNEQTERAVRRVTDKTLPGQIREKLKEMINNILPREAENKVQKATERLIPQIGDQIVGTVESVAGKTIPRTAREMLPPVVEGQVRSALEQSVPSKVRELVRRELDQQMVDRIRPVVREASARIRRNVLIVNGLIGLAVASGVVAMVVLYVLGR